MENFTFTLEQYRQAIVNASNKADLAHLLNDFVLLEDGSVSQKRGLDKRSDLRYSHRNRMKLFSSLIGSNY